MKLGSAFLSLWLCLLPSSATPRTAVAQSSSSRGSSTLAPLELNALVRSRSLIVHGLDALPGATLVGKTASSGNVFALNEDVDPTTVLAHLEFLHRNGKQFVAEVDHVREGQLLPDDEGLPKQWPLRLLRMAEAWEVTRGDPDLTIAVIDTGIVDHPDLRGRIVPGYDFINDPLSAGDGDGRDSDPTDAGTEGSDSSGFHGTHLAGILGASSGNRVGMAGIDWRAKIQPIRVLGVKRRRGKDSDIADAIRWAAGLNVAGVPPNPTPCRVMNLSFGGPGYSQTLQDAIDAARARDVVIVASAGNSGGDAGDSFPSGFAGVLSVGASTPAGELAPYSNAGPRVDFVAPGGALVLDAPILEESPDAVWSTSFVRLPEGQPVFAFAAGTSQAAAHASGVAALIRAVAPSLPADVVGAVMRRASFFPERCARPCGGFLDAERAVLNARAIEALSCPSGGCGKNLIGPSAPRPEEGCSSAGGNAGASGLPMAFLAYVLWLTGRNGARRRRGSGQ